ncbi:MAG: BlaI/MecI/CopY family transcriptional regulator [Oscillospiraceae bacterium]|nr:BlaI/MecI/CopY family transcriptional regulator [Oscillospiraceae bacterium]
MEEKGLGRVEARFADIVWEHAPLKSGELVKLCEKELSWKKSTTYTVLKKLCARGLFRNENGVVTAALSRGDFYAAQSEQFVSETFAGSLPAFIAAFTSQKKLTPQEVAEIRAMIDAYGKGEG